MMVMTAALGDDDGVGGGLAVPASSAFCSALLLLPELRSLLHSAAAFSAGKTQIEPQIEAAAATASSIIATVAFAATVVAAASSAFCCALLPLPDKLSENNYIVAYKNNADITSNSWTQPKHSVVQLAAAITSCSRMFMYPYISREDCYFTDTDSVVLRNPLPDCPLSFDKVRTYTFAMTEYASSANVMRKNDLAATFESVDSYNNLPLDMRD
ncbi:hypothetical protein KSP40_PGU022219 [Platanthera guangdongensis]|uniref:DNA-directed DNA polymerase n=1 Tax=Platanthera guangdongensis TaxID=2320717 RepID=A0ABR2MJN9_9ASPA